jgi:hypothetical protein
VQGAPEESTEARDENAHDVADIDTDHVERIVPDPDDEEEA